jgi:hypothetical protein
MTPKLSSQLGTRTKTAGTYRVDKDEFKSGMAMARNNIIQLFTKDGDTKRRDLIVRGRAPIFKDPRQGTQYSYFKKEYDSLNVDQRKAVEKVLSCSPSRTAPCANNSGRLCSGTGDAWNR